MKNITSIFSGNERLSSPEQAEIVQFRLSTLHYTADNTQAHLIAEHGPTVAQPNEVPQAAVPLPTRNRAVDAAQVGAGVTHLEEYRERQRTAEELAQDRHVRDAQLYVDEAIREAAA